jgi:hypothetical protein
LKTGRGHAISQKTQKLGFHRGFGNINLASLFQNAPFEFRTSTSARTASVTLTRASACASAQ